MNIILFGAPGTGKGTYATQLKNIYNLPHISTGDLFRDAIKQKTELGLKSQEYMNQGKLVPDELTINLIKKRLSEKDCEKGYFLDGFPRTLEQAKKLDEITNIDLVIKFDVKPETIIDRLSGRLSCKNCKAVFNTKTNPPKQEGICNNCQSKLSQRDDDKPDVIKQRLEVYEKNTSPLIEFYDKKGILKRVDNNADMNSSGFHVIDDCKKFIKNMKSSLN